MLHKGEQDMKTKEEIKKWLLENCVDEDGNLDLSGLDFSDFEGSAYIDNMKVKQNLHQDSQTVGGNLYQDCQTVERSLYQDRQQVRRNLYQSNQEEIFI